MQQRSTRWAAIYAMGLGCALLIQGCGGGSNNTHPAPPAVSPKLAALMAEVPGSNQASASLVGAVVCGSCHGTVVAGTAQKKGASAARSISSAHGRQAASALEDIYTPWSQTKHASIGVSCENCHGPGSAHVAAMQANPAATSDPTNILSFPWITSAVVCGQCHNSATSSGSLTQFDDWTTSLHRQMVSNFTSTTNTEGDPCYRCHNSWYHDQVVNVYPPFASSDINPATITTAQETPFISLAGVATNGGTVPATNPNTNLSNGPLVTGAVLAAGDPNYLACTASCATCHDPHSKTGNAVDANGNDVQVLKKLQVLPSDASIAAAVGPGASTTAYTTFNHICGQCHNARGANGSDASLQSGTSRPGFHESPAYNFLNAVQGTGSEDANGPPDGIRTSSHATLTPQQCATCHMAGGQAGFATHSFVASPSNCAPCHDSSDASSLLTQEQDNVTNQLEQLESRLEAWSQATFGQPTWWDFTSNITTTPSISSAQEKTVPLPILRARYDYYYIVLDRSFGVHNYVYADYLLNFANSQLSNNNIYPGSGPSGGLGPVPQAANLPQTHQALASARSAMVAACSAKNGLPWFGN